MKMINFKNKRVLKTLIEYILCLLFVELIVIAIAFFNVCNNSNSTNADTFTEMSNINTIQMRDEQSANKIKYEILDSNASSYYIKVNLQTQTVKIYTLDENGEYTILIKKMTCSTGTYTPTEGVFQISDKFEWAYLVGNVYGQYSTRITGAILFHSVPYISRDKSSLEYWEYDKLGQVASKGCVRLTVEDAKWIYDYCKSGTKVEFYSEDDGDYSLEAPKKISDYNEELRGWDPTDPDPQNPWLEYNNKGDVE